MFIKKYTFSPKKKYFEKLIFKIFGPKKPKFCFSQPYYYFELNMC